MESKRFTINKDEILRVGKNALIFSAPALLIFLVAIQSGKTVSEALIVLQVWLLDVVIDFLRKFVAGTK